MDFFYHGLHGLLGFRVVHLKVTMAFVADEIAYLCRRIALILHFHVRCEFFALVRQIATAEGAD